MKINYFRGDLFDISATKKTLLERYPYPETSNAIAMAQYHQLSQRVHPYWYKVPDDWTVMELLNRPG